MVTLAQPKPAVCAAGFFKPSGQAPAILYAHLSRLPSALHASSPIASAASYSCSASSSVRSAAPAVTSGRWKQGSRASRRLRASCAAMAPALRAWASGDQGRCDRWRRRRQPGPPAAVQAWRKAPWRTCELSGDQSAQRCCAQAGLQARVDQEERLSIARDAHPRWSSPGDYAEMRGLRSGVPAACCATAPLGRRLFPGSERAVQQHNLCYTVITAATHAGDRQRIAGSKMVPPEGMK